MDDVHIPHPRESSLVGFVHHNTPKPIKVVTAIAVAIALCAIAIYISIYFYSLIINFTKTENSTNNTQVGPNSATKQNVDTEVSKRIDQDIDSKIEQKINAQIGTKIEMRVGELVQSQKLATSENEKIKNLIEAKYLVLKATSFFNSGRDADGFEALDKAITFCKTYSTDEYKSVFAMLVHAYLYHIRTAIPSAAIEARYVLIRKAILENNFSLDASDTLNMAWYEFARGRIKNAKEAFEVVASTGPRENPNIIAAQGYNGLLFCALAAGDINEAARAHKNAYFLCRRCSAFTYDLENRDIINAQLSYPPFRGTAFRFMSEVYLLR